MTDSAQPTDAPTDKQRDFIRQRIADDIKTGKWDGRVQTRFPPEPNGYLHIGHAKSICLNFGVAEEFGGLCNLRFDDTDPTKESWEYVDAIKEDLRWLGFDWGNREYFASDYFDQLYEWAVRLIKDGKAYVDSQSLEEIRSNRGTVSEPGRESPFRDRPIEESLDLFERMKAGEFPEGTHVLRAKIDMASPHLIMRDPIMYRIRHRCTTGPTGSPIPSRGSRIPCARWSSRTTARCTTGTATSSASCIRSRSSSPGSTSPIR